MTDNKEKRSFSFDVINWENGLIKIPENILNILNKNSSLQITITENTDRLLEQYGIDEKLFYTIRDVQDIPDDVVINFILSESSLNQSIFEKQNGK